MSSNMVAEQTSANPLDGAARYTLSTTPLLATCAIAGDAHRFPIPKWAPRQGRNKAFTVWHSAIRQLFAAFGLTLDQLENVLLRGRHDTTQFCDKILWCSDMLLCLQRL